MLEPRRLGRAHLPMRNLTIGAIAAAFLTALFLLAGTGEARADAPNLTSRNGITVTGNRWISSRTFEVDVSSAYVAASAINGPHRIRVTLPSNYFQAPSARYPVVYLLHGGAGGNSAQWTTGGGAAEAITNGKQVITVMPDGGKVGWFTNWLDQSKGAQRWADFYLDQVIPFIDGNLRTIATKQGRGIAGLSMGGYGAVRLAQDRPDLFGSVASFSGALDLENSGTQIVICEQAVENGYGCSSPFGSQWSTYNPVKRAARLKNQNIQILLYAGSGIHDADVLERTVGWSTEVFSRALNAEGIPHFWWMYGRPGPSVPFGCDGGHNFSCWNFAFNDALPRMLGALSPATNQPPPPAPPAPGTNIIVNGGFEGSIAPWVCSGQCGRDSGGLARSGSGNGWIRNTSGWNNLFQTLPAQANRNYRVTAWIRTSANNADGYFGLRSSSGQVLGERRYGRLDNYTQITFDVNSGANTEIVVFAGLWANGDTWAQVDDVSVVAL